MLFILVWWSASVLGVVREMKCTTQVHACNSVPSGSVGILQL